MQQKYYRTTDLAKEAGTHPNTVRLYEQWGLLQPVERSSSGYRLFTQAHLDQMCLARLVLHGGWPGKKIRESAIALVKHAATGDLGGALEMAYQHLALVQAERARAEAAAQFLERWANGMTADAAPFAMNIGDAARHLGTTIDSLRNWERNGLLDVPRELHTGYRLYGVEELGRCRVIRMLLMSGYSMMAILRMLTALDGGENEDLRQKLDTPRPDEDVFTTADRWLSSLTEVEEKARTIIERIESLLSKRGA
jgi:DNA-binding transcriptional MerR regulator